MGRGGLLDSFALDMGATLYLWDFSWWFIFSHGDGWTGWLICPLYMGTVVSLRSYIVLVVHFLSWGGMDSIQWTGWLICPRYVGTVGFYIFWDSCRIAVSWIEGLYRIKSFYPVAHNQKLLSPIWWSRWCWPYNVVVVICLLSLPNKEKETWNLFVWAAGWWEDSGD